MCLQVFELDNEIEKFVQLTTKQRLKILAEQVATLVKNNCNSALPLNTLPDAFRLHFGFALRPLQYETNTLEELVAKLRSHVQVIAQQPFLLFPIAANSFEKCQDVVENFGLLLTSS